MKTFAIRPIQTIPTEELIQELLSRCDVGIINLIFPGPNGTKGIDLAQVRYRLPQQNPLPVLAELTYSAYNSTLIALASQSLNKAPTRDPDDEDDLLDEEEETPDDFPMG